MKLQIIYGKNEIEYIVRDYLERTYNLLKKNPMTFNWEVDHSTLIEFDGANKRESPNPFAIEEE